MRASVTRVVALCFSVVSVSACVNNAEKAQQATGQPSAALGASSSIQDLMKARTASRTTRR